MPNVPTPILYYPYPMHLSFPLCENHSPLSFRFVFHLSVSPFRFVPFRFASCSVFHLSRFLVSFRFVWFNFVPFRFALLHFVSFRFVSLPLSEHAREQKTDDLVLVLNVFSRTRTLTRTTSPLSRETSSPPNTPLPERRCLSPPTRIATPSPSSRSAPTKHRNKEKVIAASTTLL